MDWNAWSERWIWPADVVPSVMVYVVAQLTVHEPGAVQPLQRRLLASEGPVLLVRGFGRG